MKTSLPLHDARRDLSDLLRKEGSFEEKARGALEVGRQYLSAANGHLTRIDPETDHWKAIVSTDDGDGRFPEGLTLDLGTTYCRRAFDEDSSVTLHDAPNQGWEADPAFEEHGLHCYHGTTLRVDGDAYGTVCFVSEDPRSEPFSETETLFVEYLAQSLERELEREQHEAKLTRQTNLSLVLNRVLRHNLRNGMAVIRGFTQLMTDQLDDPSYGDTALTKIDSLMRLCEKARQLDQIIAAEFERESTDVVSLIDGVVDDVAGEYPAASITVECDDPVSVAMFPSFERAIRELVENAAKHGGAAPTVTVSLGIVPNEIEIRVSDDGPGLASHEMNVLETGTETSLTHGTGLGLWLSHWIVSGHDGSLEATDTGNGTTLTISIPRTSGTDEHEQRQTLTRTHDQYQTAFNEAGDGMIIVNDDARIVDVNTEAATIYGVERQQLLGRSIREFLPEDFDFDAEWDAIRAAEKRRDEMPVVSADGGVSAIEYTTKSDVIAPGLHLLTTRDVTERKERERELAETSERFQAFVENSHDLISVVDADGIAQYQSPAAKRLLGYAPEALVGENIFGYIHQDDRAGISEQFERLVTRSEPTTEVFDYRIRHADGSWVRFESIASNRTATAVDGIVINSRDITKQRERKRALKETTQRLESVIEVSPEPILATDADGTITVWNEAAEDVFGFASDAVVGEGIRSLGLFDTEQASQFEAHFDRVLAGETIHNREVQRRTRQGIPVRLSLSAVPLRDGSGTVTGVLVAAKDITEHGEHAQGASELRRQNDRLEEFASIVSHDLRNPLSVAEGRLDLASEECDSEHIEHIEYAHNRMYALIEDLLALARTGEVVTDFEPVDLGAIATGCWKNVETGRAALVVESDRTIQGDESRLKQLFENLIRNSIEHGGSGVTVTVGTLDGGFYLEDDGSGIPARHRTDIFESGYSTDQDGTGFGLSIVHRIAVAHNWGISATESSDGGARFEITGVEFTD